jgi:hypothetical protein
LILEVVFHIQTLVTEFVKVKGRYQDLSLDLTSQRLFPVKVPSNDAMTSPEDDATDGNSDFSQQFPGSRAAIGKLFRNLEITHQLPKRLRWATWDQDKFKGLVDRLKELNDCLLDLVDNSIKMQIFLKTRETNISFLGLHNKIDDLRQLFLALARDSQETMPHAPFGLHHNQTSASSQQQEEENKELRDLTRFKALSQSIEHGTLDVHVAAELQLQQPKEQMRDSKLDRAYIKLLEEPDLDDSQSCEGLRCEALYRGHPVWIEWKEYRPINCANPEPAPIVLARVQKLAALLRKDENPSVFRAPHCLGYFDDAQHDGSYSEQQRHEQASKESPTNPAKDTEKDIPEVRFRFGFVFAKPPSVNPQTVPISLFDLLQKAAKPSLTERVALAKTLANSIRYLHSVNWLHKGLRSQNIIFFPRPNLDEGGNGNDGEMVEYSKPYVSGFDYARPAWREEMTEAPPANPEYDIYKHPRIQLAAGREAYRKAFDVYSLGIILMEIAEWKSIDVIIGIGDPKTVRASVVLAIRNRLLNEYGFMEEIGASMGLLYRSSVWYCLGGGTRVGMQGGVDEKGDVASMKLTNEFYEKVVRRLEDIRC